MNSQSFINASLWSALVILLSACSSPIPPEIRLKPDDAPNVAQVREQVDSHIDQMIRWGGVILKTDNQENTSRLTVISLPLSSKGRPQQSDYSTGGRFIAVVDEFLEPLMFSSDREITVTGHIIRSETEKVGDFLYEYPVVVVDQYYLWPKKVTPVYVNPFPYRSRFYHDYYYYPWPYRYPRHYRLNHRL